MGNREMSKTEKLLKRFLSKPKDFTYEELKKLLAAFAYEEASTGRTAGSRAEFINRKTQHVLKTHRPHPKPIMKPYQLEEIIERLKIKGVLK